MKIEQISENFEIDAGAPIPTILSNEHTVYLIFYVSNIDPDWDGSTVRTRSNEDNGIVTIRFNRFAQFKFGSPNDEAIEGHPFYRYGLKPYSVQIVKDSEWVEELRKMNSVHPYHDDSKFEKYNHYIFFFHDSCFEIVSENYSVEERSSRNMNDEIVRVSNSL
ncbi:MAG: hypothetical protein WA960_22880 [Tunicatimonas sp.]